MDLLLSANITAIYFDSPTHPQVQLSLINTLPSRCPNIQTVTFHLTTYEDVSNGVAIISSALQRWHNLCRVSVNAISTEAYQHLAMRSQLKRLDIFLRTVGIDLPDASLVPPVSWRSPPFLGLESLNVFCDDVSSCVAILSPMSSNRVLTSLSLHLCACPSPPEWTTLTQTIKEACPKSLSSLALYGDYNDNRQFNGDITDNLFGEEQLEALFFFPNLTKVVISPLVVDIDDGVMERVARAWPRLVSLNIYGKNDRPPLSRATLATLRPLVQHCPQLKTLTLLLDGTVSCVSDTNTRVFTNSLQELALQHSPINNVNMAAAYLSELLPNLQRIVSCQYDEDGVPRNQTPWDDVLQLHHALSDSRL
ncbi:hypothetical protein DXG01_007204 [Tephrocybe rancida]|nr:hypothetical protein DXG01_007204 [Tephrocybe rancida]